MTSKQKTTTSVKPVAKKSITLTNSGSRTSSSAQSTVSVAKSLLTSGTLENIEIEYIKNLQTQVHFLELECTYLREQLEKNGLSSKFKEDSKVVSSSENFDQILKETQNELELVKQENLDLKKRSEVLNNERNQIQSNLETHHQELRKSKEQFSLLDTQHDQIREDNTRLRSIITELKLQLNTSDSQNKDIQRQLDEIKNKKTSSSELRNTITEMTAKLAKEQDSSKNLDEDKQRLLKEVADYQHQLSEHKNEIKRLDALLESTLKQNETDLLLAQKNANMFKSSVEQLEFSFNEQKILNNTLQDQIDEYLSKEKVETKNTLSIKARIREVEDALDHSNSKITHLTSLNEELIEKLRKSDGDQGKLLQECESLKLRILDLEIKMKNANSSFDETLRNREHQFQLFRHKTETLQRTLDEQINYLKAEKANNQSLKIQNDSLVLQDQSNQRVLASLKNRINELELALHQSESKQNEIFALRNELTSTSAHLNNKEDVINSLRAEIDNLNARLNHAEHLKEIENVIKSQHWEQFGEIAENMKNLRKAISQSEPKINHHQQHELNIGFDHFVSSNHSSLNSDIVVNRLDQEIPQQDFTITFEPHAPKQEEE